MPDIQTLTSQIQQLENSHGWWNNLSLYLVAGTAIVAALYFIAQWVTNNRSNELSRAQAVLIRAKDEQLAHDLKEKDVHIADADRKAAEANAKAAEANEGLAKSNEKIAGLTAEAEQARADTAEAQKEIARLTAESDKAKEGIAIAQADAARANEEVAKANERAELESLKRAELEKSLSRRSIPFTWIGKKSNIDGLKPFAGMQVIIEYVPDFEQSRAAGSLQSILGFAGWKVVQAIPNPELAEPFWDGVVVESYNPPTKGVPSEVILASRKAAERPNEAANALLNFLQLNNWATRRFPSKRGELPPNTIKVRVGLKPEPSVMTKEEEEIAKEMGKDPNMPLPSQRAQPRHITSTQREFIFKAIEEIPEHSFLWMKASTEIRCPENNVEACAFANEIAEMLRSKGWPITDGGVVRDRDFPRRLTGILFRNPGGDKHIGSAFLYSQFRDAGLEVKFEYASNSTSFDPLQILVGW